MGEGRGRGMLVVASALLAVLGAGRATAQGPGGPPPPPPGGDRGRPPEIELVDQHDADGNGWLDAKERAAARAELAARPPERGPGGPGRPGGGRGRRGPPDGPPPVIAPGRKLTPADVEKVPRAALYEETVLRTLFLEFEDAGWEEELEAFYHTDVEVPARLVVDDRRFDHVGVQFRGNSSFFTVSRGQKRSLSITIDPRKGEETLDGHGALTLLNGHADPTFLRTILGLDLARQYIPAPRANLVRVVINGECWGIYVNQERFSKEFLDVAFGTTAGTRFKSSNRARDGALGYLGDSIADYRRGYETVGSGDEAAWKRLVELTRVLAQTPVAELPKALEPILDVDGALRYLAWDIALMSGDGYWLWGSDYNLYLDPKGLFHLVPRDANEGFSAQSSNPRSHDREEGDPPQANLSPLAAAEDPARPLYHRLLAVPEYRERYLRYVRDFARDGLDWAKLEPKVKALRALIAADVEADTRKLASTEAFTQATFGSSTEGPPPATTLHGFILARRASLLADPAVKGLDEQGAR